MAEYCIKDPQQGLVGPVGQETVRDLLTAGALGPGVLISKDNGAFVPLSELPELQANPEPSHRRPSFAGDLGRHTFFRVFYRFFHYGGTGCLTLRDAGRRKDIYLKRGEPIFVASNIPDERIGSFLVRRRKLTPDQRFEVVQHLPEHNNNFAATTLHLGFLTREELVQGLREQQFFRLIDLCLWQEGRYAFYDGDTYEGDRVELHIDPPHLVVRAAREMPTELMLQRLQRHLDATVERLPQSMFDAGIFELSELEQHIVQSIDARRTLRQMVADPKSDAETRRTALTVLYLLWEMDAVTFS